MTASRGVPGKYFSTYQQTNKMPSKSLLPPPLNDPIYPIQELMDQQDQHVPLVLHYFDKVTKTTLKITTLID